MPVIKQVTEIPGPRSRHVLKQKEANVARGISVSFPIAIDRAEGVCVTDLDGNQYIDLAAGIASLNVGHSPAPVVKAIEKQLRQFINPIFNVMMHEPYIELASELNKRVPGDFEKRTVFFNSGAEGIENAVKIARKYTGRKGVITFFRSFHGRTLLTMTMTGKVGGLKRGFAPLATDIYQSSYPHYFQDGRSDEELLAELRRLFDYTVAKEDVAAIVMEPIQGDGGFNVPSNAFVQGVRDLCDEHGILLIADEIQTGFGRSGKLFAMEHFDAKADLTVMSKSIAAGIPLSAVTGRESIMNALEVKELGGTLSGNPLACVASLEVLKMIDQANLLARAQRIGEIIKEELNFESAHIGDIRGRGAMMALEFVQDKKTKAPCREFVREVVQTCFKRGVLLMMASDGDVIRLLPPLIITDEALREALAVIRTTIQELENRRDDEK